MLRLVLRLTAILLVICLIFLCVIGARSVLQPTPTPSPTPSPTPVPTLTPSPPTSPDTGWQYLRPGLDRRMIRISNDANQHVESLYIYRIDQTRFWFDVAHRETPQSLEDWQSETNALLAVNGGFFRVEDERYLPNGLTVINGQTFGSSYEGFGGMLAIGDQGAEVRSLAQSPYDPGEVLRAGLQSFPLLVKPGGELGFPAESEDNLKARRTVIGQDRNGRILILLAPRGYFTLHQLSLYLTGSDLDLDIALNLDGGPSSGVMLAEPREVIPSQTVLPIVILVYSR